MHMGSNPTCGDNNTSFGSWNIIGCCEMAWLRRIDVCTKEVVAAFYNSACGAAHLDTEVSKDVSRHTSFLECLVAAAPSTSYDGAIRTSDTVSA
jgi:hypothetical protein